MISCLPCFFDGNYELNGKVAYTQVPPTYPEDAKANAYLDASNAQFFRLLAMIRNCCGGVSPASTNTMWLIPRRPRGTLWEERRLSVHDHVRRERKALFERQEFNISCRIEGEATSMERVFRGQYSHYVNRRLAYGMPRRPEAFLGARQRHIEGAVTLSLQWLSFRAVRSGPARGNVCLLWLTLAGFLGYILALMQLAMQTRTASIFTRLGLLSESTVGTLTGPVEVFVRAHLGAVSVGGVNVTPDSEVEVDMCAQFVLWMTTLVAAWVLLRAVTTCCKCFGRCCFFPSEMKWWGRLLISVDNITYFAWCWMPFFWLAFIVYAAVAKLTIHFNNLGLTAFMLVLSCLQWGLVITSSLRYSLMESADANEVAKISLDNVWRANQLFFIYGPLQVFSIFTGSRSFARNRLFGQDIGDSQEKDRTVASVAIVRWWTLLIILSSVFCWGWFAYDSHKYENALPACVMLSIIALDMIPPCVYLWVGDDMFSAAQVKGMAWMELLKSPRFYKRIASDVFLSDFSWGCIKLVGPIWLLMLPVLTLWNPFFGIVGAFALVSVSPAH